SYIAGFSLLTGSNSSAAGTMFVVLKSFGEREGKTDQSAGAIAGHLSAAYSQVQEGLAMVFPPPPVRGIGTAGGFKIQIEDRTGQETPQQIQATIDQVIAEARKDPRLTNLVSSFRASVPQLYANFDRTKAKQQNVS